MQMLPPTAATSFEHRGPQCLPTLTRSTSPPLDQFHVRVCSCPLCCMKRLCVTLVLFHLLNLRGRTGTWRQGWCIGISRTICSGIYICINIIYKYTYVCIYKYYKYWYIYWYIYICVCMYVYIYQDATPASHRRSVQVYIYI